MASMSIHIDFSGIPSNLGRRVREALGRAKKDPRSRGQFKEAVGMVAAETVREAIRRGWSEEEAYRLGMIVCLITAEEAADQLADHVADTIATNLDALLSGGTYVTLSPIEESLIIAINIAGEMKTHQIIEIPNGAQILIDLTTKGMIDGTVFTVHLTPSGRRVAQVLAARAVV